MNKEQTYDEKTKIWSGGKSSDFYHDDCSIGRILFAVMKNYPNNTCQVNDVDGKTVTNQEMLTWSIRLAQHFKKMGLRYDDVIGIIAKNTTYMSPVAFGCFFNCTPFHAINPILDKKTLGNLLNVTKPKVIFCDADVYEKVHLASKHLKSLIYILSEHVEGVPTVEDLLKPTQTELMYTPEDLTIGGDQTVAILCSSGTTGMPKAVCLSNKLCSTAIELNFQDVVYTSSGLDWMTGLRFTLRSVHGCKRIISNRPFSAEYLVHLVQKYKITITTLPPRNVAALIRCQAATKENLASIKLLVLGGSCMTMPMLEHLRELLPNTNFLALYGLTEFGRISANICGKLSLSVGKVFAGVRVRIVDEQGTNLGPNETGEILLHNGRAWKGYYGNPMETLRMQDALGWYHTGDLGYFDDQQCLYVVDRKKEILKYQGMHYSPTEIEKAIAELPQVEDVCVVGVNDELNGDAAGALVVLAPASRLTEEDIKQHVLQRLEVAYKQLHAGVRFVDELPQNSNGKTLRREAQKFFQ